jgi:hypothetical protein
MIAEVDANIRYRTSFLPPNLGRPKLLKSILRSEECTGPVRELFNPLFTGIPQKDRGLTLLMAPRLILVETDGTIHRHSAAPARARAPTELD